MQSRLILVGMSGPRTSKLLSISTLVFCGTFHVLSLGCWGGAGVCVFFGGQVWGGAWDDRMPVAEDTMYTPPPPKAKASPRPPPGEPPLGRGPGGRAPFEAAADPPDAEPGAQLLDGSREPARRSPKEAQFRAVRAALLAGDVPAAEAAAKGWGAGALGTFQYAAALRVGARPTLGALDRRVNGASRTG